MIMLLNDSLRLPELMDTTYSAPSGSTIVVGSGGDFQAALNSANLGDTITLNAGSTYSGNYTLPVKSGSSYIHIRSSATLTTEGTRVTTSDLSGFPKIQSPNTTAAIQAAAGSHHYRFINCDIKSSSTAINGYLVGLGTGSETDAADFPHHIIIDRCGVRGSSANGGRRGVMFAGSYQAVIDSYVSDWKEVGADTQAIGCWTGYGPYKISNNYLEGAGENVLFGGAGTGGINLTPSDIEITNNTMFKPLTWKASDPSYGGVQWSVKNILELKHARRVLVSGNLFENCWGESQDGFAILLTVRNQTGSTPWAQLTDVTFEDNTLRNSANGINCLGWDNDSGIASQYATRALIYRNLLIDIGGDDPGNDGILFLIQQGYRNLHIDHNTGTHTGSTIVFAGQAETGFQFTNNIVQHNTYGVKGSGVNSGTPTLDLYAPGYVFQKNALVMAGSGGATSGDYPADNFFPATIADVGFVNSTNNADLRLAPSSIYNNAGTDGTDLGADKATPA